jgi:hypothetical protein
MRTKDLAIDLPERFQVRQIFLDIDDIPGETNEMFGPCTALGHDRRDIAEGLADLRHETIRQFPRNIPADHATGHDEAAVGRHAIGVSLRHRPATRLQNLQAGIQSPIIRSGQDGQRRPFWHTHD